MGLPSAGMLPSTAMAGICREALEVYAEHPDARTLVEPWALRFARSVESPKTAATVKRVATWFGDHAAFRNAPGFNGSAPTPENVAWRMIGGDAGQEWANEFGGEAESLSAAIDRIESEADERETLVAGAFADEDRRPEWTGVLALEGVPTSDNRLIEVGALGHRTLPVPLQDQLQSQAGHDGAVVVGAIHEVRREETDGGALMRGSGTFDSGEEGMNARRRLSEGSKRGVSVDLVEVEIDLPDDEEDLMEVLMGSGLLRITSAEIAAATIVSVPAFADARLEIVGDLDELDRGALVASGGRLDGVTLTVVMPITFAEAAPEPEPVEWFPISVLAEGSYPGNGPERIDTELYEIDDDHAGTALAEVQAEASTEAEDGVTWFEATSLVAAGAPKPPADWFAQRTYSELTPVTIEEPDEHGLRRIHGHVAGWGSCHIGFTGRCVDVPRGLDYSSFQGDRVPGQVTCSDGTTVKAGPVIADSVHPNLKLKASDAAAHYAHSGSLVAQVRLFEDRFGLQQVGWVMPGLTDDQLARLAACDYSPDWRPRASANGGRGVVAVLAVPVSGFNLGLVASAGDLDAPVAELAIVGSTWTPKASVAAARKAELLSALGQPVPEGLRVLAAATEPPEVSARKAAVLARLNGESVESCGCGGSCCA